MPVHDGRQYSGGNTTFEPVDRHIRRTPSPPTTYYERPFPSLNTPYRDEYQPAHKPETWRPERNYFGGSLSPERYSYTKTTDEGQWPRPAWRSPTSPAWPDRRPTQNTSDNGWPKQRRETATQPMLEPSDSWKQTHGVPAEPIDRSWAYDPRAPNFLNREGESSPQRALPRDYYSPPGYTDRYKKLSQASDFREPEPYDPRSEPYRPYEDISNAWTPSTFYPSDTYATSPDTRFREPERPAFWDTRGPPRSTTHDKYQYRHERSVSTSSTHDDNVSAAYRSRATMQGRHGEHSGAKGKWKPHFDNPNFIPTTPRSRMSSNSYTSPRQTETRSRSSSGSSHGNHQASRLSSYDTEFIERRYRPASQYDQGINDGNHQTYPYVPPVEHRADNVARSGRSVSPSSRLEHTMPSGLPSFRFEESRASPSSLPVVESAGDSTSPHLHALALGMRSSRAQLSGEEAATSMTDKIPGIEHPESPSVPMGELPELDIPLSIRTPIAKDSITSLPAASPLETTEPRIEQQASLTVRTEEVAPAPEPEPMPMYEALRVLVMVRLQLDSQTREERVDPILLDNLSKVESIAVSTDTPDQVVRDATRGAKLRAREEAFKATAPSLRVRFAQRQVQLKEKVEALRAEYLALHEQWLVHCSKLDDVAKNVALQEAAATAGRTTRRSLATMGDAVRSDLEMEQIIASLGTEEMTDANHLGARNAAVIPDMITVDVGEVEYTFDDTNNEIDNPAQYYAPQTGIDDWTEDEVAIYVEKFAEFPKQFGIIAASLPHKTAAQCVTFYYLHKHRHIDFRQVVARRVIKRKRGGRKQKSNALLADIEQRDDETPPRRRRTALLPVPELRRTSRRNLVQSEQTPTATPTPEPEAEQRKRRRRPAARVAIVEDEDGTNEAEDNDPKPAKRSRRNRKPLQQATTPLATPSILGDIPPFARALPSEQPSPSPAAISDATWSETDKALFRQSLAKYGHDLELISASLPTKTSLQVAQYYQRQIAGSLLEGSGTGVRSSLALPLIGPGSFATGALMPGTPLSEDGGGFESHLFGRIYSRDTSGVSTPVAPAPPVSSQYRQFPFEPARNDPEHAADTSLFHVSRPPIRDIQLPLLHSMSHLGVRSVSASGAHIANPSPFAATLPSPAPAAGPASEPTPTKSSSPGRVSNASSQSPSMVFDTPPFVPAPQAWTRAPLQTTADLVAYLEHRTKLARQ